MMKQLNILFFICFIGVWAQDYNPVAEFYYPTQVQTNSSFEISIVTDNSLLEADTFKLFLITKNNLYVNALEVKSEIASKNLKMNRVQIDGITDNVFLSEIDLQENNFQINAFFQIVINIIPRSQDNIRLRLYGEFIKDNRVISTIGETEENNLKTDRDLTAEITQFNPAKTLKNAAQFEPGSSLTVELREKSLDTLWIGFWLKITDNNTDIIRLSERNKTISKVYINELQKLCIADARKRIINSELPFISKQTWNHFGIELDSSNKTISYYLNGRLIVQQNKNELFNPENVLISFGSVSTKPFYLEQFRILIPKLELERILQDCKYLNTSTEISDLILQLNFDSDRELTSQRKNIIINYSGIKYIQSDAPVISRAPELNIKILNSFNQLEWTSSEPQNISSFVIEKSSSQNSFSEIGMVHPSSDNLAKYNFIDESVRKFEIVYYRIKQINKDGSVVYSSQVKVGMGNIEQFKLNQNYPNPFNPSTSIEIDLFEDAEIEVTVYNLEGQELAVLQKGFLSKGIHKFEFDASEFPSGVYLYKVSSPVYSQTKKMLLTK